MHELFNLDTLRIHERLLDLVLDNWAVAYLGYYFYLYKLFDNEELNSMLGYLGMLGICQLLALCLSLFLPRANEKTMECYTRWMPDLLYGLAWASQLVAPCATIIFAIIIMTCVDESYNVFPYLVFTCILESGIFI